MTDAEWRACEDPGPLLDAVRGRASDRQLRLFACACARSVWGFVPPGPCRDAVEVSLRFADGGAATDELAAARAAAIPVAGRAGLQTAAAWAACETAHPSAARAARTCAMEAQEQLRRQSRHAAEDEARAQADFLRDILGGPDLTARADPARRLGLYPAVREIAQELYADGPREDMAALADELERLDCRSAAVLDHCRSPGPHVRGCWVLDILLGRETAPLPVAAEAVSGVEPWREPRRWPRRPVDVDSPALMPRADQIRAALSRFLGPKRFRRCLRKAVGFAPGPGRVARPPEWDAFVQAYPELNIRDDELVEVCTTCIVHARRLEERIVRCPPDGPEAFRHAQFLQARAQHFPNSHPAEAESAGEPERFVWWCPECQEARAAWTRTAGVGGVFSHPPSA